MLQTHKQHSFDPGDRKAVVLEFIAASAIFAVVVVVLYIIFTYRPA